MFLFLFLQFGFWLLYLWNVVEFHSEETKPCKNPIILKHLCFLKFGFFVVQNNLLIFKMLCQLFLFFVIL